MPLVAIPAGCQILRTEHRILHPAGVRLLTMLEPGDIASLVPWLPSGSPPGCPSPTSPPRIYSTENSEEPPSTVELALPVGLAPTVYPQTTGCFSFQLRERNGGVRRVTLPLGTACKAGASLFSHGPTGNETGTPPWCCPKRAELWRLCCSSAANRLISFAVLPMR